MLTINRKEFASLLIAFSFFQFGILQPIAVMFHSQNVIAVSTIITVLLLLVATKFSIRKYVYLTFASISVVFFFSYLFFDARDMSLLIFGEFLLKSFSLFLIGSFPFSTDSLKKYFYLFSLVNFVALSFILVSGQIEEIEYMRFGYALLPTLLVVLYLFKEGNKVLNGSIIISSFLMIFIFGSRGPLVGLVIFILILLFINKSMKFHTKVFAFIGLSFSFVYLFFMNGLIQLLNYLYFDLGFDTYSIAKLRMMVIDGLAESSSGRDYLYQSFMHLISENPVFGNGIGITNKLWDVTPHNIFLQILLEFGIVGMFVCVICGIPFLYFLLKIQSTDNELFILFSIIFSVSFGRLLVSSDLWLRPEFWMFLSMTINSFLIIYNRTKKFKELKLK
ncbi:O-antigen ligase family protein [Ureibacillus manganicus]|uniref:O-antigen ligase-related domain-containing protein n=1 Tax=Ureibacillus manganicus DSM 26584 TaxID=1384049 RepID=A0A0A3HUC9_9BACL|nr:O-antigen polymerase [Ureibacillus manganicus]KGR76201.1 hypothetical protein CD29_17085 [Ureibacillus manganicus DSM 26584]